MSKYYAANGNGDWWSFESNADTLWIISEAELMRLNPHLEDLDSMDKLNLEIVKYGYKAKLMVDVEDINRG